MLRAALLWLCRSLALGLLVVLFYAPMLAQPSTQAVINARQEILAAQQERRLLSVEAQVFALRSDHAGTAARILVLESDMLEAKYLARATVVALIGQLVIIAFGVRDHRRRQA